MLVLNKIYTIRIHPIITVLPIMVILFSSTPTTLTHTHTPMTRLVCNKITDPHNYKTLKRSAIRRRAQRGLFLRELCSSVAASPVTKLILAYRPLRDQVEEEPSLRSPPSPTLRGLSAQITLNNSNKTKIADSFIQSGDTMTTS